jgi:hypothetical protein
MRCGAGVLAVALRSSSNPLASAHSCGANAPESKGAHNEREKGGKEASLRDFSEASVGGSCGVPQTAGSCYHGNLSCAVAKP